MDDCNVRLNSNLKVSDRSSDKLHEFLNEQVIEHENKLQMIEEQRKRDLQDLTEWESKLSIINHSRVNNSNLFSPNIKTFDIIEVNSEIERINKELVQFTKEKERLQTIVMNLKESARRVGPKKRPKNDIGLNILQAQEQDRQRIARDLHDSTIQNLTGMVHKSELCTRLVDLDPTRAKLELTAMTNNIKGVINEMRDIIYNLKPMSLDDLGFVVTVERYTKQLMMNHNIKVTLKSNREKEDVLPVINLSLFRVVQEACHNVIKHAKATRIDINIMYQEECVKISIQDNGIGFDIEKQKEIVPDRISGFGLSIMKERIYLLSGTMEIHSENKKGTIITITVPITKREGEEDGQTY